MSPKWPLGTLLDGDGFESVGSGDGKPVGMSWTLDEATLVQGTLDM